MRVAVICLLVLANLYLWEHGVLGQFQDSGSLLLFKRALQDPSAVLENWQPERFPVCNWTGVLCGNVSSQQRVVSLDLSAKNLSGPISAALFSLPFLSRVDLSSNYLYGSIPEEIGNASRLTFLDLSRNTLWGSIPGTLGKLVDLEGLRLHYNDLVGPVPLELRFCHKLTTFYLGTGSAGNTNNGLNGTLPGSLLSNLTSLKVLWVQLTLLTGDIPDELGGITSLTTIYLWGNAFTGAIPPSLGNLTRLQYLSLERTRLEGALPVELGRCSSLLELRVGWAYTSEDVKSGINGTIPSALSNCSALRVLSLPWNQLSGDVPLELMSLQSLVQLDLSNNDLSGTIPATLANLTGLDSLLLVCNDFTGSIPSELGLLTALKYLSIGARTKLPTPALLYTSGRIGGPIPPTLGFLQNLQELRLWFSELEGTIPVSLGNCTSLQVLYLNDNNLRGGVPSELPRSLVEVVLKNNMITGGISPSFANYTQLARLDLQFNDFEGPIPPELGLCEQLVQFSVGGGADTVSNGKINGSIPQQLGELSNLQELNIFPAQLGGRIPETLGNCTSLTVLQVTGNPLSGTALQFSNLTSLQQLILDGVHLEGSITGLDWQSLSSLAWLHLSNNGLSGTIPDFPQSLRLLSLSGNSLTGSLPSLKNASWFSWLDVQGNALTGDIQDVLFNLLPYKDVAPDVPNDVRAIILSGNRFHGNLPTWVDKFSELRILAVADNRLGGAIPASIAQVRPFRTLLFYDDSISFRASFELVRLVVKGSTTIFQSVTYSFTLLDLSGNKLDGAIPSEMGYMEGLRYLNLSHNHLNGTIPSTVSNLLHLEQMDLSFNALTGSIPMALAALSDLNSFNVSFNNLSGSIPSSGQFASFTTSYIGNPGLCGKPLNLTCSPDQPKTPQDVMNPLDESSVENEEFMSLPGFFIGFTISFLVCVAIIFYTEVGLSFIWGPAPKPRISYDRIYGYFREQNS